MARLSEDVKVFIVQRLAMFESPSRVVERVKETFDLVVDRQTVHHYDPTVGEKPAKKWVALFTKTREQYVSSTAHIPIAHKTFRLEQLQTQLDQATKGQRQNPMLVLDILERAAKEAGDAYTNVRVLKANDPKGLLAGLLGVDPTELDGVGHG
jgi:hypothetical protein